MRQLTRLVPVAIALGLSQAAFAADPPKVAVTQERAQQVYDKHFQCAIDLAMAGQLIAAKQPEVKPKFDEAFTSYLNRLHGVAEVIGLDDVQVRNSILERTRLLMTGLADSKIPLDRRAADMKMHVDRSKEYLRSIGYSIS